MQRTRGPAWTIVLAAGESRRLGRPKQFLRFGEQSLLRAAVTTAAMTTPRRVVVVVGAEGLRVRSALRRAGLLCRVRFNRRWQEGMATSLAAGLNALPASAAAALVLVVDQPLITPEDTRKLLARWSRKPRQPVASAYAGRIGVPAVIPRKLFGSLARQTGDSGARGLLRAASRIETVPMPNAAIDVDTIDDARALATARLS